MDTDTARKLTRVHAALLWFVALILLFGAVMTIFVMPRTGMMQDPNFAEQIKDITPEEMQMAQQAMPFVGMFFLLPLAILYVVAGIGVWALRNWARILAIVLCIPLLFSFPIGTLIGGMGLWLYIFNAEVKELFTGKAPVKKARKAKRR